MYRYTNIFIFNNIRILITLIIIEFAHNHLSYFLMMTIIMIIINMMKTSLYNDLKCIYIHLSSTTARKAVKTEKAFVTY